MWWGRELGCFAAASERAGLVFRRRLLDGACQLPCSHLLLLLPPRRFSLLAAQALQQLAVAMRLGLCRGMRAGIGREGKSSNCWFATLVGGSRKDILLSLAAEMHLL